ncbi:glutathione S-transferase N-terminal domain-containing protein [Lichenicoccus sp.]|uniref:glutathione S-transferase N-terminal domain-containing protein n=1 Tax=Lichenicoccus sp. TaxID=2781899 RepID=UPI003D0B5413
MIDFFFWTTPNGQKVMICLEETGLPYRLNTVNISKGEQLQADFLEISPNNKIPAIRDNDSADGAPLTVFESGAILFYLAEKSGTLLPLKARGRVAAMEWVFWQVGGLGPMAGQNHHFAHYAPEKIPYAIQRYVTETGRLYGVLDKRLAAREFILGEYSIADIAAYPWVFDYGRQGQDLDDFPNVKRWFQAISARPAVRRAREQADAVNIAPNVNDQSRAVLFGQGAARSAARAS